MTATGTQLASLAQTLAQEDFDSDVAVGVLEKASGHGRALEAARATLAERLHRTPGDQVAKQALSFVEAALEQHTRSAMSHPQYVHCGNCGHKGAYLVPDRPIVRCKYCSAVLTLDDAERTVAEADLEGYAARLG